MKVSQWLAGGAPKLEVPDYKTYTVGDHTPELKELERKLAIKGLKDPWIRNEVWRYDTRDRLANARTRSLIWAFRGIVPGFILGTALAFGWFEYDKKVLEPKHGHGHH